MKTILIAVDTFYPKKDGVVSFLDNIVPKLAAKYKIKVLAPDYGSGGFDLKNVEVVKFAVSETKSFAGYNRVLWNKKAKEMLKKHVRDSDLIFSQDVALIGRKAIIYGRKYKKPVINYVHQISWEQFGSIATKHIIIKKIFIEVVKYLTKKAYEKCLLLLVPSVTSSEELQKENVTKEKVIVPLGVNIEKFKPTKNKNSAKVDVGIDPNKKVIGYCGRISKEKNLETLSEAFAEIRKKNPDVVLLIIGGGEESQMEHLKAPGVKITGFVKNVAPYLQALDIFVLPSLTETTSLATMEAMACGVPALTTPAGRLKEYVKNSYNGYLFPRRGVDALTKRLDELLSDPAKVSRLGNNARRTMLGFSWEATAKKMIEIFEKFIH
ncbi:glycosyltransferase family 4 protein [Candidatus Woesearchaeota archaeon]|nr:glycosyltransferase family 4 protein [Candidatus Woesearchaeota archaeon]